MIGNIRSQKLGQSQPVEFGLKNDVDSHCEDSILQVTRAVAKLQKCQGHEKGYRGANKKTGEDIGRGPPERETIAPYNFTKLVPERRCICDGVSWNKYRSVRKTYRL